jgi:hypothetical protein
MIARVYIDKANLRRTRDKADPRPPWVVEWYCRHDDKEPCRRDTAWGVRFLGPSRTATVLRAEDSFNGRTMVWMESESDVEVSADIAWEASLIPTPRGGFPRPPGRLVRNAIRCLKCGVHIESKHRHDFVWCPCGAVAVDGGLDYAKRAGNHDDWVDASEWADD